MKLRFLFLTLVAFLMTPLCGSSIVHCEDLDGQEIMKRQHERHALVAEKEILELELIKKSGKAKQRRLERYSMRNEQGLESFLAVMVDPEEVRGTGVLLVERDDGEDQQWLYMPALGGIKKVDAKDRKSKFMGTDFCYGDIRSDDISQYRYRVIGDEEIDGRSCFVVEATPLTDFEMKSTGYSKRVFKVAKDIFFVLEVEYYDTRGQLKKVMANSSLVQVSDTVWRADHMEMTTVRTGHRSVMKVLSREIEDKIDPQLFTVDGLKSF